MILKNTYKKVFISVVLISLFLVLIYWLIPIRTMYRTNIKQSDISIMNIYRRGYFNDKYTTPTKNITDKEKMQGLVNYLNNIRTSKRFNDKHNISENDYQYVLNFYTTNKVNYIVYVDRSVLQVVENNKVSTFNIVPQTNVLEYFDSLFK